MGCGFESHRAHVNDAYLFAAVRTPFGRYAGALAASRPDDLAVVALRGILDCVNVGGECAIEEGLAYESTQFGLMFSTDDMREGTSAFLERRKAAFTGS